MKNSTKRKLSKIMKQQWENGTLKPSYGHLDKPHSEATKKLLSEKAKQQWKEGRGRVRTGFEHSEETKKKMSEAHGKGEDSHNWKGGKPNCLDCEKMLSTYKMKRCQRCDGKARSGSNSPMWIADRSKLKKSEKKHLDGRYRDWMLAVKNRDNWKCRMDNEQCEGHLASHHILDWVNYPELRYDINNGITLCHAHHPRGRAEEKRLVPVLRELVSVSSNQFGT